MCLCCSAVPFSALVNALPVPWLLAWAALCFCLAYLALCQPRLACVVLLLCLGTGLPAPWLCLAPCLRSFIAYLGCFVALPFLCSFLPAGLMLCCASALLVPWLLA